MNAIFKCPFFSRFSPRSWLILSNLSGSQVVTLLMGLGSSSLWARNVTKEVYGQYQLIVSLMKIVAGFCLNGVEASLTISAAKGYDGNLGKVFKYKLLATLMGGITLAGCSLYYFKTQPAISVGLLIAACLFPFYEFQKIWMPWFRGKGQFGLLAYLDISRSALSLSILGVFILLGKCQLYTLLSGLLAGSVLLSIAVMVYIFRNRRNQLKDWETIRYGFHVASASLLTGLLLSDKVIINEYLSIEKVAIYSMALVFPNQIKTFYSIFNQMLTPQVSAAKDVKRAWEYLKPKFPLLVGIFSIMGVAGFVLIPILIPLLFSHRYADAAPCAKWLWLSRCMVFPTMYLGSVLTAQKKTKFMYLSEIMNPVILVVLFMILVRYGLWGIVASRIISNILSALFCIFFFLYYLRRGTRNC